MEILREEDQILKIEKSKSTSELQILFLQQYEQMRELQTIKFPAIFLDFAMVSGFEMSYQMRSRLVPPMIYVNLCGFNKTKLTGSHSVILCMV